MPVFVFFIKVVGAFLAICAYVFVWHDDVFGVQIGYIDPCADHKVLSWCHFLPKFFEIHYIFVIIEVIGGCQVALGKLMLTLGSDFLPLVTQRLGEKGRKRRRVAKRKEYTKAKYKDIKKTTDLRMGLMMKYYPKVSRMVRANRDEAMDKIGKMYHKKLRE